MKSVYLAAAALAAVLALPGASAQTNEINIGITISTSGPACRARRSRA